ncbi:MAG: flagellar basal body P-ring formation chaperone FlgA [Gammaproteobacteria bacterium]
MNRKTGITRYLYGPAVARQGGSGSASRGKRRFLDGLLAVFLTLGSVATSAGALQDHADIASAAERAAAGMLPPAVGRRTLHAGRIDERLRMPRCGGALDATVPAGMVRGERLTVAVSCSGPKPWKLHVPVAMVEMMEVVVARSANPRGAVLDPAGLALEERDITQLRQGYHTDPADLAGQRLRRSVAAGQVIQPGMLKVDPVIRRGQRVTLVAGNGSIQVKMAGLALGDGATGQRIPVRNLSSDREIEGVVRSAQQVEVLLR